jgi:ribosome maturation factor RimP
VINKETINAICSRQLSETKLYVTGIRISSDNKINVFIDGDEGVSIKDCVTLSRAIEGELNRDREDFSLDVSSHGAATPLAFPRQYKRHVGRDLEILKTDSTKLEGKLLQSDDNGVEIEVSSRENKTLGKGKTTVVRTHRVLFIEMKETKIKLKY